MPRVFAAVVGAGHGSCHDKLHPMPRGICACFRAALEPLRAAARAGCRGFRAAGVLRSYPRRGAGAAARCAGRAGAPTPSRPAARPRIPTARGRREPSGMTVRNTRAFASRGGARECYFISVGFEGGPPARAGQDAMGGGLTGMRDSATLLRAEQSRAEQSRAEQSRAEQSRAEQSRAEHGLTAPFLRPAGRLKLHTTFVMDNRRT